MSGIDENINKSREFNIEKRKPTLCKFYNTKDGCKNGTSCKFLHETPDNWRTIVKKEFSPEEQIVEEIKSAKFSYLVTPRIVYYRESHMKYTAYCRDLML